jgi:flagella basal body P-ring formation protein FlgA
MGCIIKRLELLGSKGKARYQVLFDSGASASFLRESVARKLGEPQRVAEPVFFKLDNGTLMKGERTVPLQVNIESNKLMHLFVVASELPVDVIIGADFMQRYKIKLDPISEEFILDKDALKMILV